jgi:hypothetical protein
VLGFYCPYPRYRFSQSPPAENSKCFHCPAAAPPTSPYHHKGQPALPPVPPYVRCMPNKVIWGLVGKPYRQPHKPFPQEMACAVLVRIVPK